MTENPSSSPNFENSILVAGQWRASKNGSFPVIDPATEEVIAHVADGTVADAIAAADGAAHRFESWSQTSPRTRSDLLMRSRELMLRDADELAELISRENGKSLADAKAEVNYAAEFFRWYAEEAVRPHGDFGVAPGGGVKTIVSSRPVGVACLVVPWNFPAAMATRKIAPALAAGCTVVLKPAHETPLTAIVLCRILAEAGIPDGVVNLVTTRDAASIVSTWMQDERVRTVSFTGSTGVGRHLLRQAADSVMTASMELGGCAPFIVTDDADLDAAIDGAMVAKFRNGGQACTAANTFFVHSKVSDLFTARLAERVAALTVGSADSGAEIGPLISAKAVEEMAALVAAAVGEGAQVVASAPIPDGCGHFFSPTVLADVMPGSAITTQEIFGPIAPIVTWTDIEELLENVNASEFGLASYVYSGDLQSALRIAERLESGMVGINRGLVSDPSAPFGGTKQSGVGREGARAGIEEYLETQYYSVAW